MSERPDKPPLNRPLPWMAIAAAVVIFATAAVIIAGAMLNRLINNGCVGDCLTLVDTAMQAHMALAAWSVVIVSAASGAASLYLIWRTLQAALRSAKAAEDNIEETRAIGRAASRAYLSVTDARYQQDYFVGRVTVSLKNSGQSPASRVKLTVIANATISIHFEDPGRQIPEDRATARLPDMAAGTTLMRTLELRSFDPSEGYRQDQPIPTAHLEIRFEVSYEDVFGDTHPVSATFTHGDLSIWANWNQEMTLQQWS